MKLACWLFYILLVCDITKGWISTTASLTSLCLEKAHGRKKTLVLAVCRVPGQDGDQHCGNTDKVNFSNEAGLCKNCRQKKKTPVLKSSEQGRCGWTCIGRKTTPSSTPPPQKQKKKNKQICRHMTPGFLSGYTRVDALNGILMFCDRRGRLPLSDGTQDVRRGFTPPRP